LIARFGGTMMGGRENGAMIYRDPRCVFVADSLGLAEVIVVWLADHGIPAEVMNPTTLGGLDGLTWLSSTAVGASGLEVWVMDPAQAGPARDRIAEHRAQLAAHADEREAGGQITALCEDCGKESSFPGSEAGKVLNCLHCGEYIDVPDRTTEPESPADDGESVDGR
jgi:hypothetical protein